MKKALVALAFSGMALSAQAATLLSEGFDNVGNLTSQGWVLSNASAPPGSTSWFQGVETIFPAYSGDAGSYAAANYNNAGAGGIINNWLITPEFATGATGATVSFWLRAAVDPGFSDQLSFGFSNGSSALNAFSMSTPVTIGTDGWVRYAFDVAASGNARFAVQYTGSADLAAYVGIDSLSIDAIGDATAVPEPTTMAILFAGVMGLAMSRRRKRG
ncbi:PEP-CTERM sorting domain-containing protein [Massilia sp. CFBP 13721]|nr:PEP-CTERM sorting domain-containing protein [Massilia sp. CFBP 13721]